MSLLATFTTALMANGRRCEAGKYRRSNTRGCQHLSCVPDDPGCAPASRSDSSCPGWALPHLQRLAHSGDSAADAPPTELPGSGRTGTGEPL
jgi:hypothetical protein